MPFPDARLHLANARADADFGFLMLLYRDNRCFDLGICFFKIGL